jgi:hypothetical protein
VALDQATSMASEIIALRTKQDQLQSSFKQKKEESKQFSFSSMTPPPKSRLAKTQTLHRKMRSSSHSPA